jgi:hypothetical protein
MPKICVALADRRIGETKSNYRCQDKGYPAGAFCREEIAHDV